MDADPLAAAHGCCFALAIGTAMPLAALVVWAVWHVVRLLGM